MTGENKPKTGPDQNPYLELSHYSKPPEYGELGKIKEETARLTKASIEAEAAKKLDFATAANMLERVGMNLGHEIDKSYDRDSRYGLLELGEEFNSPDPDELTEREDLSERMKYHQHFQHLTFDRDLIEHVISLMEFHSIKIIPICTRGGLLPAPLFRKLFIEAGIPYRNDTYGLEHLANLRKIDPKVVYEQYKNLKDENRAMIAAYQKAKPLEPTRPGIVFTVNEMQTSYTLLSGLYVLQLEGSSPGEKCLGPVEDFLRFISQVDNVLKKFMGKDKFQNLSVEEYRNTMKRFFEYKRSVKRIPDSIIPTYYPDYAYEDGSILQFEYDSNQHKVELRSRLPSECGESFSGTRPNLGT